jgi:hypothetical protein
MKHEAKTEQIPKAYFLHFAALYFWGEGGGVIQDIKMDLISLA